MADSEYAITLTDVNGFTKIGLGQIFREGTNLHIVRAGMVLNDIPNRILRRFNAVDGNIVRASGFVIGSKHLMQRSWFSNSFIVD